MRQEVDSQRSPPATETIWGNIARRTILSRAQRHRSVTLSPNRVAPSFAAQQSGILRAYIVRHDGGFSPNPFGRICTLACCKPMIRRSSKTGDIIVGTGSAADRLAGRLIYAMLVDAALPFDDYWTRYPSKRPSRETAVKSRGDNIWRRDSAGNWRCVPGAIHGEDNRKRDLSGCNALISSEFYYFGRDAILIPQRFRSLIATTQGHKNTTEPKLVASFWAWIKAQAQKPGRVGLPVHFDAAIGGVCECNPKGRKGAARC